MAHESASFWEAVHHFLYKWIRGRTGPEQYVGTVKMNEAELEKTVFHPNDVFYNWLAYWKRHPDGRNSTGSWKLRYPRHSEYVDGGMQVHITLFPSNAEQGWIDVFAHYEYDNIAHPFKHVNEEKFSAPEGVTKTRHFFNDNDVELYDLRTE